MQQNGLLILLVNYDAICIFCLMHSKSKSKPSAVFNAKGLLN